MHILLVDDSRTALVWLKSVLEPLGHRTTCVESAAEGLQAIDRGDVDLVMTDFAMPAMDGAQLLQEVRRRLVHLPVVVMSGVSSVEEAVELLRLGADEFLAKPIRQAELLSCLDRVIAKARVYAEARLFAAVVEEAPPRAPMERLGELLVHYANVHHSPARAFTLEALEVLLRWNASDDEFEAVVETCVRAARGPIVERSEVLEARAGAPRAASTRPPSGAALPGAAPGEVLPPFETAMRVVLERFERLYLERLLGAARDPDEARRISQLDQAKLSELLGRYKLVEPEADGAGFLEPP